MYITLVWIGAIVLALSLYIRQKYTRFSRHGVKSFTPFPPFGNLNKVVLKMEHAADEIDNKYKKFPEERFVGRYEFLNSQLIIRDLDLIKKITVKDFEHFLNHRSFIDEETDPLFGRNLFALKGQDWKDMRSTLSPAFTSSKIRLMVPLMVEVGEQMIKALKEKSKASTTSYIDVDVKDMTTRFANDVIASCAFGLKVDSHLNVDNPFYVNVKKTSYFRIWDLFRVFAVMAAPKLMKFFNVTLIADSLSRFFKQLVKSTMQDREERNIIRPDMIHLLMEAKKGRLVHEEKTSKDVDAGFATVEESNIGKRDINREWSQDDLTAQAVLFFIAGFETVSTAMSFLLHELAVNPDVQRALHREVAQHAARHGAGGRLDYTSIQRMTYMDMVVSETLRLWPPAIATDRVCVKDYNCGKPNDRAKEDYIVRKGEGIAIPVMAIHRDPQYFPDPLKFDPERFSEDNKQNIHPFSYMPFGLGPRNCIGSRFALCEVKVMVYQLLKEMQLSPAAKTRLPARLSTETFNIKLDGGHWVRMTPRN